MHKIKFRNLGMGPIKSEKSLRRRQLMPHTISAIFIIAQFLLFDR